MQLEALDSCEHNEESECHWCFVARHDLVHPPNCSVEGCLSCKLRGTIQLSPKAIPSKRSDAPSRTPNNSWEKGLARDSRGMPLIKDGKPVTVKQYGEQRHEIDRALHRLENDPSVYATTRS